jgi:hypothetical protein
MEEVKIGLRNADDSLNNQHVQNKQANGIEINPNPNNVVMNTTNTTITNNFGNQLQSTF